MKIYLDSANIEFVISTIEKYGLAGVTSNPTILLKNNCKLDDFLSGIPGDVMCFAQVIQMNCKGMIEDAYRINEFKRDAIIKIPATAEGYKAMCILKKEGKPFLATAVYSLRQAVLSIQCGASFIAPYVNRMNKKGINGIIVTDSIQRYIRDYKLECEVIAASLADIKQIEDLSTHAIDAITISEELFIEMLHNEYSHIDSLSFLDDWKTMSGKTEI